MAKQNKQTERIKSRNYTCVHYDKCLEKAAFSNTHNLACRGCKKFVERGGIPIDFTYNDVNSFEEYEVGKND